MISKDDLGLLLVTLGTFALILIFSNSLLTLASEDFVKNYLFILSISLFGFGFISLQIKNKILKKDLLNASLYTFISMLLGLIYLVYNKVILLGITFATLSIWGFLAAFLYFFLILIKERAKL